IKRFANVKKNYEGKMQGLNRTNLLEDKFDMDKKLHNNAVKSKMGKEFETVISKIDSLYDIKNKMFNKEYTLSFLNNDVGYYHAALTILNLQNEAKTLSKKQQDTFWNKQQGMLEKMLHTRFSSYNHDIEFAYFKQLVKKLEK